MDRCYSSRTAPRVAPSRMRSIRRPLFDSTTRSAFNCFAPPRNDVPKAAGRQGGIVQEHKPDSLWQVIPMYRFVPKRVPELVIDPKATGWYRIYAGLYHDSLEVWSTPHLFGKISGEKFPEFLQAPSTTTSRVAETYWKAADLTGKTIYIFQPPAPMAHKGAGWMGGISHLRLVPMSEQEVAAAKHEIELPPTQSAVVRDARCHRRNLLERHCGNGGGHSRDDLAAHCNQACSSTRSRCSPAGTSSPTTRFH